MHPIILHPTKSLYPDKSSTPINFHVPSDSQKQQLKVPELNGAFDGGVPSRKSSRHDGFSIAMVDYRRVSCHMRGFLKWGYPQSSSISRWMFHELNHPAIGDPHEKPPYFWVKTLPKKLPPGALALSPRRSTSRGVAAIARQVWPGNIWKSNQWPWNIQRCSH